MSGLRREWTKQEINQLTRDLAIAKVNVLVTYGFTIEEIIRVLELPESTIRCMLDE